MEKESERDFTYHLDFLKSKNEMLKEKLRLNILLSVFYILRQKILWRSYVLDMVELGSK